MIALFDDVVISSALERRALEVAVPKRLVADMLHEPATRAGCTSELHWRMWRVMRGGNGRFLADDPPCGLFDLLMEAGGSVNRAGKQAMAVLNQPN